MTTWYCSTVNRTSLAAMSTYTDRFAIVRYYQSEYRQLTKLTWRNESRPAQIKNDLLEFIVFLYYRKETMGTNKLQNQL